MEGVGIPFDLERHPLLIFPLPAHAVGAGVRTISWTSGGCGGVVGPCPSTTLDKLRSAIQFLGPAAAGRSIRRKPPE